MAANSTGLRNMIGEAPDVLVSYEHPYIAELRKVGLPERLSGP
jgi:hypothetical protein